MVFKQDAIKMIKRENLLTALSYVVMISLFVMSCLEEGIDSFELGQILFASIMLLLLFLDSINDTEIYYIYKDRIEVKNGFEKRTINKVYFDKVKYIEETEVNVYRLRGKLTYYIFNDGRENGSIYKYRNKSSYNLGIYKTPELEAYLENVVKVEIKKTY